MKGEDFYFESNDNLKLHGCKWEIEKPTAIVCLIHGMGEHIKRYDHVAEAFNTKQISVWGFDHRGHGTSEGKKGHTPSIEYMFDDIEQLLVLIRKQHPNLPVIIYGHSMGGNLSLNFLLHRNSKEISFGVISSPWLRLTNPPKGFQLMLAKFGARFIPSLAQPNGLNVEDISSVKEEQEAYANDPLNHDRITAGLFMGINTTGEKAIEIAGTLKTPILLAHGTADNITSPKASEAFAKGAPTDKVELKFWNGLRHETHNEHNKEEVIGYYVDWVVGNL
ncbi:Lysophospholipase; Monoglyceride lipase; putative [hydrothermal vent metagenome]|uniref:Lysophospholipase Monoglyceride lipase putative n=1 Tax=hydrothermal vent metagenome TaxID=652676 RepID=A0A3B0UB88_9ZZZZ